MNKNRMMIALLVLLVLMTCSGGVLAQNGAGAQPGNSVTVIHAGHLLDGSGKPPRNDQAIVIAGNRVQSVSAWSPAAVPPGAAIIDLSAATVLPGLIDSHTHIFLQGEDPAEGGYDVQLLKQPLSFRAARATVAIRAFGSTGLATCV